MNCNTENGEICYWDSYGLEPNKEVVVLMNRLKEQGDKLKNKNKSKDNIKNNIKNNSIDMKIKINDNRHQYKNSECGMYCIYFITTMMNGENFKKFVKVGIPDAEMIKLREYVFAN